MANSNTTRLDFKNLNCFKFSIFRETLHFTASWFVWIKVCWLSARFLGRGWGRVVWLRHSGGRGAGRDFADILVSAPLARLGRGALVPVPPSPERDHFPWRGAGVQNKMKNKIMAITFNFKTLSYYIFSRRVADSALVR